MAWELFAEKNGVSFSPAGESFGSGALAAQFSVMTGRGLPSEQGGYVRVTIDNRTPVVLPFYMENSGCSVYGEFDEELHPSFANYPLLTMSLPVAIQQEDCSIIIGAQDNYFAPESYEGNHTIKIETGSDDGGGGDDGQSYTKLTKSIEVKTRQTTVSANDPTASSGIYEFEKKKTMHISTLVPFHAVDTVTVTAQTESVTRPDPYGC